MNTKPTSLNLPQRQALCQHPLPGFEHVPTEYLITHNLSIRVLDKITYRSGTRQGHPKKILDPLPRPGLVLKKWSRIYSIMVEMLGSVKQARMVEEVLRCQAVYGLSFPSARFLAEGARCSEKTWDRCLAYLRSKGWVDTVRTKRANGQRSVNLLDLRKLWKIIVKIFQSSKHRFDLVKSVPWVKVHGAWIPLQEIQSLTEPSF